jgi:hypothetical protein
MKKMLLIIPVLFFTLVLSACTQTASVPDDSEAKARAKVSPVPAETGKGTQMRSEKVPATIPPKPTVPANLDRQTQTDLKELDKIMDEFDTTEYSADDLSDL